MKFPLPFNQLNKETMENFTLKFGKHKGEQFLNTPKSYQEWLLKQEWFKVPNTDSLTIAQKQFSDANKKLGSWNGYSKKGEAVYDTMFESEKAMDNAIFNNPNQYSSFYDGSY